LQGSHYGVVEVLKKEYDWFTLAKNEHYENRIILSFKLKMTNDQILVYNFHFDKEEDSPAFNLLVNSSIIDAREVLRLIHALCLLLEVNINEGLQEGVENNASSEN